MNKNEKKGAGKPALTPKRQAQNQASRDKYLDELTAAAKLNGFPKWSTMMTHIKNAAKQGRATVSK
jgi:hypothetical protein